MFFKFNKNKDTENLKLSDYDQIWTKFCFLDESGSLSNPKDPFFTLGILKISQPYYLLSKILYERNKRNFHDEMKFNKLSNRNIDFIKFAVDCLLGEKSTYFYSYSAYKKGDYFCKNFAENPWLAYERITMKMILGAVLAPKEILILIADHVTVPKNVRYEVNVKREVNKRVNRLAMAGVCRFDSKSNDLLQLADLIIGAISYDLKISTGVVEKGDRYKKNFLKFLKENLGAENFLNGFRNRNFNIFVDKDAKNGGCL